MKRFDAIDFRLQPFQGTFLSIADQNYQGYYHYHQGIEFLYVHNGQGKVILDRHVYPIEPGSLFIFQPYQLHYVRAVNTDQVPYVRTIIQFDPAVYQPYIHASKHLDRLFHYIWKKNMQTQHFARLHERYPKIEALIQFYASQRQAYLDSAPGIANEMFAFTLTALFQAVYAEMDIRRIPMESSPPRAMSHTEAVLHWIEDHFAEPFDLERLAGQLHLSKYYLSRLFREETGQTISDYLAARRIKEACRLLHDSDLPVAEIGVRAGWPIASHFTQQFKRWVGCTPLQYRKRWNK